MYQCAATILCRICPHLLEVDGPCACTGDPTISTVSPHHKLGGERWHEICEAADLLEPPNPESLEGDFRCLPQSNPKSNPKSDVCPEKVTFESLFGIKSHFWGTFRVTLGETPKVAF